MKLRGFINAVYPAIGKDGQQRAFTTKENEKFACWNVEVDVKRYGENGTEYKDEFILEYNKKEDGTQTTPFIDLVSSQIEVECNVAFSRNEWNNRKFMSSRLISIVRKES